MVDGMDDSEYVTKAEFYWMLGEIRRVFDEGVNRLIAEMRGFRAEIRAFVRGLDDGDRAPMLMLGGPFEFIEITADRAPRAPISGK